MESKNHQINYYSQQINGKMSDDLCNNLYHNPNHGHQNHLPSMRSEIP